MQHQTSIDNRTCAEMLTNCTNPASYEANKM